MEQKLLWEIPNVEKQMLESNEGAGLESKLVGFHILLFSI